MIIDTFTVTLPGIQTQLTHAWSFKILIFLCRIWSPKKILCLKVVKLLANPTAFVCDCLPASPNGPMKFERMPRRVEEGGEGDSKWYPGMDRHRALLRETSCLGGILIPK